MARRSCGPVWSGNTTTTMLRYAWNATQTKSIWSCTSFHCLIRLANLCKKSSWLLVFGHKMTLSWRSVPIPSWLRKICYYRNSWAEIWRRWLHDEDVTADDYLILLPLWPFLLFTSTLLSSLSFLSLIGYFCFHFLPLMTQKLLSALCSLLFSFHAVFFTSCFNINPPNNNPSPHIQPSPFTFSSPSSFPYSAELNEQCVTAVGERFM